MQYKLLALIIMSSNAIEKYPLGRGGRTFESCHPDHLKKKPFRRLLFYCLNLY